MKGVKDSYDIKVEKSKKQLGVLRDHTGTCDYRKTNAPPPTHSSYDTTQQKQTITKANTNTDVSTNQDTNTNAYIQM